MNTPYPRIFLSVLLASFGLTSCADTPSYCALLEESCESINKTLDDVNCICIDVLPQECQLTPPDCQDEGKILDTEKCVCLDAPAATVCQFGTQTLQLGDATCDEAGRVILCQTDGTMSEGTPCTEGICKGGTCVRRDCEEVGDGKNICQHNTLMICDDGQLTEDLSNACDDDMPLCRDGQAECSGYSDCGLIPHNQIGCKENKIVLCQDGETSLVDGGDCVSESKSCFADASSDIGFVCKKETPTDCKWKDGILAQGQTVCDGNVLRKCSEETDGTLSPGLDCADNDDEKIYCDPALNQCRAYRNCGENGDIPHGSVVCNIKGTNKAQCQDGKLVNLSGEDACPIVENASTVCTFDTVAVCTYSCNKGYVQINNECQRSVSCNPYKEIYDADSNTCTCDNANHWAGTAGSCACENGYVQVGVQCEAKQTCDAAKEIYDAESNTCTCDNANHWVGTVGSCACEDGYVQIGAQCEAKKTCDAAKETYDELTNTCTCDNANHWAGTAGNCACEDGYVQIGAQCEAKKTCDAAKEIYDAESNTCTCDNASHWAGTPGSCACETGYVQIAGLCEPKVSCNPYREIYDAESSTCKCDETNHFVPASTGKGCACEAGYGLIGTVCQRILVGDIVTFGHYEQDNDTANGKEPIEWRVLAKDQYGKILLLSDKALDVKPMILDSWNEVTLKYWLNGGSNGKGLDYTSDNFIDAAFTPEEKATIYGSSGSTSTNDKLFLLYDDEVINYLAGREYIVADATRYAVKKNARVKGSESGKATSDGSCTDVHCISQWWVVCRECISTWNSRNVVSFDGSIIGTVKTNNTVAVRPALWLRKP